MSTAQYEDGVPYLSLKNPHWRKYFIRTRNSLVVDTDKPGHYDLATILEGKADALKRILPATLEVVREIFAREEVIDGYVQTGGERGDCIAIKVNKVADWDTIQIGRRVNFLVVTMAST